ncbi:MAG: hypothetical protein HeimC3_11310 [Candidatus Heimdallarchaeota archaeon LC_3]|nr:MAG: hypothetical protein HeimC3_11310 [Candidatus Heimdallarchaeota archaeon LC_3]
MSEPLIACGECQRSIPRSKRITIKKNKWSAKTGDTTKNIDVCFYCYRNDKMKEVTMSKLMILIFTLFGIFTFIIKDELIFLSGSPNLQGLPTSQEPYILITLLCFGIALFFFLAQRRFREKLKQARILYE